MYPYNAFCNAFDSFISTSFSCLPCMSSIFVYNQLLINHLPCLSPDSPKSFPQSFPFESWMEKTKSCMHDSLVLRREMQERITFTLPLPFAFLLPSYASVHRKFSRAKNNDHHNQVGCYSTTRFLSLLYQCYQHDKIPTMNNKESIHTESKQETETTDLYVAFPWFLINSFSPNDTILWNPNSKCVPTSILRW